MTDLFLEMSSCDIQTRIAEEGRPALAPLIRAHEIRTGGPVTQDDNLKVAAGVVDHPPVTPAFGYRFDAADRSIVISGDTTPTKALIGLAAGADVLVHNALLPAAVARAIANLPNAQ